MNKKLFLSLMLAVATAASAQVTIDIDANQRGPMISPTHYGIFFEDINHAADGGLYAELIRNRSFEDGLEYGKPADMQYWLAASVMPWQFSAKLIQPSKKVRLLNDAQQNALQLTLNATPEQPARLINEGYWGINAVQGRSYRLSLWVRGSYKGTVKAVLFKGDNIYAETEVAPDGVKAKGVGWKLKEWTKLTATMTATANDPTARFALVFDGKGTIDIDVVSLFPPTFRNRENGMRPDLANMLYQMHPKFMRFPGGCFVEGQISPENAFRWERTIGPIEERPGHWNVNWGYRTSDGMGFHEYLQLAEDLGAKPLYVVNIGLWHGGMTPVDSLQPWIDETLAALEYANGDITTKYGAMRAKNGHPEPFNIEYLEIGNENNQPDASQQSDHYYDRFKKFKEQVLARYPQMHLIGNVAAWGTDEPKWYSDEPVELLDEHYYRTPSWFVDAFHKYDSYPRAASKIYVGEYAVTNGFGNLGNMNAALGEAVYMMGMENNSDVVPLNSYAPIFVNENDARWRPDMIRFNSHQVMGTPSYYVQMLMPRNIGTQVVRVTTHPSPVKGNHKFQTSNFNLQTSRVTPRKSRVGYATWATQSSYTHCEPLPKTGKPEFITGGWEINGEGILQQKGNQEGTLAMCTHTIDSDHYTIQCRARKDSGAEGFIIVFNYVDERNYCWVNFGGWGNTQHAIEQVSSSGKIQTVTKPGKVETGRWYDVRLTVAGDSVKAWLGDELVFDTVLKQDTSKGIFSSATIDDPSGELIVKVVNTADEQTTAYLNLTNFAPKCARVIRLSAADGMDENTLDRPTAIVPVEQLLSPDGNSVLLDIPPYSLNIVRIKK